MLHFLETVALPGLLLYALLALGFMFVRSLIRDILHIKPPAVGP